MQPEQAKFLLGFLLPQLKSEQMITKKILSAIPPDQGEYQPDPKCMSSFKLAWHLAATEVWFLDALIDLVFKEDDSPMPSGLKTGGDVARWYDENFARRVPRLETLSGEHLITPVVLHRPPERPRRRLPKSGDPPFRSPSRAALGVPAAYGRQGSSDLCRKRGRICDHGPALIPSAAGMFFFHVNRIGEG
jgi:hypothetical protein